MWKFGLLCFALIAVFAFQPVVDACGGGGQSRMGMGRMMTQARMGSCGAGGCGSSMNHGMTQAYMMVGAGGGMMHQSVSTVERGPGLFGFGIVARRRVTEHHATTLVTPVVETVTTFQAAPPTIRFYRGTVLPREVMVTLVTECDCPVGGACACPPGACNCP